MSFTPKQIEQFLEQTVIPVRLSFLTRDGSPTVASHWYLYGDGVLWCAVQQNSFVARCLEADSRCAFEVAGDQPPYRGVRGRGHAHLMPEQGTAMLERLMARYLGDSSQGLQKLLRSRADNETAIRVAVERMSSWDFSDRMS